MKHSKWQKKSRKAARGMVLSWGERSDHQASRKEVMKKLQNKWATQSYKELRRKLDFWGTPPWDEKDVAKRTEEQWMEGKAKELGPWKN